jgi:hypothetical protein
MTGIDGAIKEALIAKRDLAKAEYLALLEGVAGLESVRQIPPETLDRLSVLRGDLQAIQDRLLGGAPRPIASVDLHVEAIRARRGQEEALAAAEAALAARTEPELIKNLRTEVDEATRQRAELETLISAKGEALANASWQLQMAEGVVDRARQALRKTTEDNSELWSSTDAELFLKRLTMPAVVAKPGFHLAI